MIFEINANDIERLNEELLVTLLRRLIQAELYKNSIPLRSGTAPAQINIPDGGDDARVSWLGGPNETDWLPSRFTVFQCKKGKTSPSGLKAETHTKSSQKFENPQLNEAIKEAISQSGAYVVVTATPVVGTNIDRRVDAIKEGISDTRNDPSLLSSIQIYDCNKLAVWTNTHPSVALWVNSLLRNVHLDGFQTFEDWSRAPETFEIEFQQSEDCRFIAKGAEIRTWEIETPSISQEKSFDEIVEVVSTFFLTRGNAVRVIGPSGYGKTRFVHQLIASRIASPEDMLDQSQIIYCIYENVKDQLPNIVRQIADTGSRALFIVDDCPDAMHITLNEIVHRAGSKCLLLTIGVETKTIGLRRNLIIELGAASDELIDHIAAATNRKVSDRNASLIRNLSQGFPRMAVYASQALEDGDEELSSVETLISRIVWGDHEQNPSALQSLQLLSLFTIVGLENNASHELAEIALHCEKTERDMYRELSRFTERGVLFRQGDYGEVQPLPLAMRLSNQWLEESPAGSLETLFNTLSEEMKLRLVGRLRWVAWSDKVRQFACVLLAEALPDDKAIDSEFGSKLLNRFVHLAPDETMGHLYNLLANKSIDELAVFEEGRRHTIWALEKLVFRRQTFDAAARLLLKLGAAENENWSNNASGQFTGLFQLHLSGTEATPAEKLLVLDDGLSDADGRIRQLCIKALDRMLESGHFSRSGGSEHIGAGEALEDWQPRTYGEIFDYYRAALSRLTSIALNVNDINSKAALSSIGSHLRNLFCIESMLDEIQAAITKLRTTYLKWYKAAFKANECLYYDRNRVSEKHQERLRAYYDELLPKDPLERIYFYSSGWAIDIHDPDVCYENDHNEYDFGSKKIIELVEASPNDVVYFLPLIDDLLTNPTKSGRVAISYIAKHVSKPKNLVQHFLDSISTDDEIDIISNFLRNVISGAAQANRNMSLECMELALGVKELSASSIEFIASAGLDDALMHRAIELVKNGTVEPNQVLAIAFSDVLQKIDHSLIEMLISSLLKKQEHGAWAAIDFLARVLYGSNPKEGLLLGSVVQAVVNPALFNKPRHSDMDWYYWCELVKKLLDGEHIDEELSAKLIDFIISVTHVEEYSVQLSFDGHAQNILRRLISIFPHFVWEKYHDAVAGTHRRARYRLRSLFQANIRDSSDPSVLNDIPKEIYVSWMLENKEARLPFILDWIQLFTEADSKRYWAPDFVSLIDTHLDCAERLDVLRSRLTTGVWVGSFADKLVAERDQLIQLLGLSTNMHVHRWIHRAVSQMEQQIINERRQDANREAFYRA